MRMMSDVSVAGGAVAVITAIKVICSSAAAAAKASQMIVYPRISTSGETTGSDLRAAVSAISAYVRIIGPAVGSIIASVMAAHMPKTRLASNGQPLPSGGRQYDADNAA